MRYLRPAPAPGPTAAATAKANPLFRIVIVRMRWHEPSRAYVERRTAQDLSKKDSIRYLKRYVAREVYELLPRGRTRRPSSTPRR